MGGMPALLDDAAIDTALKDLPGWDRFPAAQYWLQQDKFAEFVSKRQVGDASNPADKQRLFKEFLEWTQNEARDYPPWQGGPVGDTLESATVIDGSMARVLRGGSYIDREDDARVVRRDRTPPGDSYPTYGLRPVRTLP